MVLIDGKQRNDMFVKAYNETRKHGGINGLTQSEIFLQRLITSTIVYVNAYHDTVIITDASDKCYHNTIFSVYIIDIN